MKLGIEHFALAVVAAGVVAYVGKDLFDTRPQLAGGAQRHVAPLSVRGSALDVSMGQITPTHLLWWGQTMRPPGWVPHRVSYPTYPGQNLEILQFGAPGGCPVAIPLEQRTWIFEPPSEVDL